MAGDWFGAVNGDAFDLIVCNPPYAISPDSTYRYRDSGWHGVDLCWILVRGAAERLNEGGYGHVVSNWIERADDRWPEVARRRVENLPCDACVSRYGGTDPLSYAVAWNRTLKEDRDAYERVLRRWLACHERLQVREIGQGIVMLRRTRRHGPRVLLREGTMLPRFGNSASEHAKAIFRAIDIGMIDDADMAQEPPGGSFRTDG